MRELESGNAPKSRNRLEIKEAFDADLHANNLTDWDQEYDQISPGRFKGSIAELPFEGLQVFKESTNQALQQKCLVWPKSLWLGIPLLNQASCRINGIPIEKNQIMCRPGTHSFELSTPKNYELFGMVVEQTKLQEFSETHKVNLNWSEIQNHGRLGIPNQTLYNVRFILSRLLAKTSSLKTSDKLSADLLMTAMLELLSLETPEPLQKPSYKRKKRVVDEAKAFIAENSDIPITVTELCKLTHVSQRTLQYSFESILGISPIQYLRTARLNGVRRDLLCCDSKQNIFDLASHWGFWHMSQFAKDYKHLFGESPSETKGRLSKQIKIHH